MQRTLLHCAARGIAVYSPHTALDACTDGIDDWLADGLEPKAKRQRIQPASNPPKGHESAGSGMLVSLSSPATVDEVVQRVKRHLAMSTGPSCAALLGLLGSDARAIGDRAGERQLGRFVRGKRCVIVACEHAEVAGGSVVKGAQADLIWTGEMGHHEILAFTAAGQHVILCTSERLCPS